PKVLVCGTINWDTTLFVERLPNAGQEIRVMRVASQPGGKGANTAVAAAKILGKNSVANIGMLGFDEIGDRQRKILQDEGVDTNLIFGSDKLLSGQAYVIVDKNGEDMILTFQAANMALSPQFVESSKVLSAIEESTIIIVIDPPLDAAAALIKKSKVRRRTVIFVPALLTNYGFSVLEQYIRDVDYLILNQQEAETLTSIHDGIQACTAISRAIGGKVVVTLGHEGCMLCSGGKGKKIAPLHFSLSKLNVASTVGAGDTLVGAFGAFKVRGFEDVRALYLANIAAALKTTREQTRASPTYEEIQRYVHDDED
ncbi:MAG: PfkB family carbohydrate kinase, partial [Thermoproteota archaeon]|nr:PfkB family carbohydrate kinase [Thermoproteota archaeon]